MQSEAEFIQSLIALVQQSNAQVAAENCRIALIFRHQAIAPDTTWDTFGRTVPPNWHGFLKRLAGDIGEQKGV